MNISYAQIKNLVSNPAERLKRDKQVNSIASVAKAKKAVRKVQNKMFNHTILKSTSCVALGMVALRFIPTASVIIGAGHIAYKITDYFLNDDKIIKEHSEAVTNFKKAMEDVKI